MNDNDLNNRLVKAPANARESYTPTSGATNFNMKPQWHCTECGKLLGVTNGNQLHIRVQKHREYLVGFPVTANCHGCGTLNKKSAS
jgi:hypothetical protein